MKKGYRFVKSTVDALASLFGVILFAPLFLFLIIIIDIEGAISKRKNNGEKVEAKPESKPKEEFETKTYFGGAILGQERLGKNEKRFFLLKFRSMKEARAKFDVEHQTIGSDDDRVTAIGKFIRRFKIDELLQLINVLKGDMSLVGPRPLLPKYADEYDPWMKEKFLERPGMTGLAQVNGGTYLTLDERSYFDVYYVRKATMGMDVRILFKTVAVVIAGEQKYKKDVTQEEIAAFIGDEFYIKKEKAQ